MGERFSDEYGFADDRPQRSHGVVAVVAFVIGVLVTLMVTM